ncbi:MAG: fasciclin domain-containing protein [Akkermansiaceae bacterium]
MKTKKITQYAGLLVLAAAAPLALAQSGQPAGNIPQAGVGPRTEGPASQPGAATPAQPAQPGQPAQPAQPATPAQPAQPGQENVAQMIQSSDTFTTLGRAIAAAGLEQTLADRQANYTIFAPTDAAFDKLPAGLLGRLLEPENRAQLRSLLLHHVVSGRVLAADLKDGNVKTVGGEEVEIDVQDDKIEVGNTTVVSPDMRATNGVIHGIDQVLVPDGLKDFIEKDDN